MPALPALPTLACSASYPTQNHQEVKVTRPFIVAKEINSTWAKLEGRVHVLTANQHLEVTC